jgi:hypothetical protein
MKLGLGVGSLDGEGVGAADGIEDVGVGWAVGSELIVGVGEGWAEGSGVGTTEGRKVVVGKTVGRNVGAELGFGVGSEVRRVGDAVGL